MQKSQVWNGVYTVVLVEGQDMPESGQGDVFVRFRLGEQRFRSKVRFLTLNILFYLNTGSFICSTFYNSICPSSISPWFHSLRLHFLTHCFGCGCQCSPPNACAAAFLQAHLRSQHALLIWLHLSALAVPLKNPPSASVVFSSFFYQLQLCLGLLVYWANMILIGWCQDVESQGGIRSVFSKMIISYLFLSHQYSDLEWKNKKFCPRIDIALVCIVQSRLFLLFSASESVH